MAKQTRKQRQSRKQKQQQQQGGARRKTQRKASSWAKAVGAMYRKMKQQNKSVTLADAMRAASRERQQGKL
jgi:hypothetical protein